MKHYGKDPSKGSHGGGHKAGKSGSNPGPNTGLKKSDDQRADVVATPKSKDPYPHGLA